MEVNHELVYSSWFVHVVCSHHRSDGLVLLSSCGVKLRACDQEWDEPRIQFIIFNCSIEQLRKDLPGKETSNVWLQSGTGVKQKLLCEVNLVSPCCPVCWYRLQMPQGTERSRIWAERLNLWKVEMYKNTALFFSCSILSNYTSSSQIRNKNTDNNIHVWKLLRLYANWHISMINPKNCPCFLTFCSYCHALASVKNLISLSYLLNSAWPSSPPPLWIHSKVVDYCVCRLPEQNLARWMVGWGGYTAPINNFTA